MTHRADPTLDPELPSSPLEAIAQAEEAGASVAEVRRYRNAFPAGELTPTRKRRSQRAAERAAELGAA